MSYVLCIMYNNLYMYFFISKNKTSKRNERNETN